MRWLQCILIQRSQERETQLQDSLRVLLKARVSREKLLWGSGVGPGGVAAYSVTPRWFQRCLSNF